MIPPGLRTSASYFPKTALSTRHGRIQLHWKNVFLCSQLCMLGGGCAHSFVIKKEILGFLMAFLYRFWSLEWQCVQQAKFGNSHCPACLGAVLLLLCLFGEVALVLLWEVPHYCTSRLSHGGARSRAGFQAVCVSFNVANMLLCRKGVNE